MLIYVEKLFIIYSQGLPEILQERNTIMKRFFTCVILISILIFTGCNNRTSSDLQQTHPDMVLPSDKESANETPSETQSQTETESPSETQSQTETETPSETESQTETETPSETESQTETETPSETQSDRSSGTITGNKDTRAELEAMDNTKHGHGPGVYMDELNRPTASLNAQNTYGQHDAYFIVPDSDDVYLTFDLGYEYNNNTPKILDVLKAKNVKAVFFATLDFAKRNPETVRRIIDEGHVLGNHSANHYSMPTLTIDQMEYEIMFMHNYIKENFGYEMWLFRPPTGAFSDRSLCVTQNLGYKTVSWSFAYLDYDTSNQPAYDAAFNRVSGAAHPGAIYLLHGVSNTNVDILPALIDNLRAKNYSIELFK